MTRTAAMWPPNEASPAAKPTSRPLLVTLNIKRVVDAIERAVATPQDQIVMHRAFGRQVLGQRAPLAARAQDIHNPVHHFPDVNRALVAARFGRGISGATCAHSASVRSLG